jgi:hypothetical protein
MNARAPAAHLVYPAPAPSLPQGLRHLAAPMGAYAPPPPAYGYSPSPLPYYSPQLPAYSPQPYSPPTQGRRLQQFAAPAGAGAALRFGRQTLGASPPAYYSPPSYSPSPLPYYSPSPAPYYAPEVPARPPVPDEAGWSRRLFGAATEFGTTEQQLRQWSRQMMQVGARPRSGGSVSIPTFLLADSWGQPFSCSPCTSRQPSSAASRALLSSPCPPGLRGQQPEATILALRAARLKQRCFPLAPCRSMPPRRRPTRHRRTAQAPCRLTAPGHQAIARAPTHRPRPTTLLGRELWSKGVCLRRTPLRAAGRALLGR